jgi:hypothetical protein
MSIQQMLLGGGPSGYNLTNSLRFRASASANLSRTPASAGNRKTWTWSAWVKRGTLGSNQVLFISKPSGGTDATFTTIGFTSSNTLLVSGLSVQWKNTTQVFRDPSAWYHIVITWDTTQATASNRVRVYVNGSQVTAFGTTFDPSLNFDGAINQADVHALCAADGYSSGFFDGYLAEINFIDGQALTPSSFGSTNALTGVWQPAPYTGTYGTNGFYLKFTDNSTAAALGTDFSGNSNTWTVNNISITAGVTYDSMTDVPTLTSATASNFAVMNPINSNLANTTLTANLTWTKSSSSNFAISYGSIGVSSGKYYFEATISSRSSFLALGFYNGSAGPFADADTDNARYQLETGTISKTVNGSSSTVATGASTSNGVIGIAIDCDAGEVSFYHTNTLQATATGLRTNQTYFPRIYVDGTGNASVVNFNFGQQPFTYTPPTGFVALNTFNLPTATIVKGNTVMDATLYTGTGASLSVTNAASFRPDLVWLKSRSNATDNELIDSVRGVTRSLISNSTAAEAVDTQGLTAFNSNGFTLGTDANYNGSARTFVGWQWQAGQGTNTTNTAGSITSTVSVNASAGFSVVTYTGTGANATIGHGLGVAPRMIIVKDRSAVRNWGVYHASLGNTAAIYLNVTNASSSQPTFWNSTSPTSSVISVGTDDTTNRNTFTYVAYCFAEIAGFSKFGSYTGNGSADGPLVYTGFKPAFLMIKRTDSTGEWWMYDNKREPFNVMDTFLIANGSSAEIGPDATSYGLDFVSNGFKWRSGLAASNGSGGTYIYMAFAENPFKNSLAR